MKIIILAWGFATRLWPITEKRAKPLLLLNNKEIISHIVDKIPEKYEIIISTNNVFEDDFLKWKKNNFKNRNINIFIEDSKSDKWKKWALWATSLVIQKEKINEDLMLIAWDNYFWFDFEDFIQKFNWNSLIACFDIKEKEKAKSFWVVASKDWKNVDFFEEKPLNPSSTLVSTWCYIFPKNNLKDILFYSKEKSDDLWWIFEYLKWKWENINIFTFEKEWFDIGSFEWYLNSHKLLQKEKYIEKSAKIENSNINNKTYIWKNCEIKNSKLENCLIFWDVKIENCELRDCIIDKWTTLKNIDLVHKLIRENWYFVR